MYQIANIKEHPKLEQLDQQLTFLARSVKADKERLEAEAKELMKNANDTHQKVWKEVEDYIIENNLVDNEYVRGEEDIGFSKKHKTLIYKGKRKDDDDIHPLDILRRLLT